jgi:hypothetical protein
VWRKIKVKAKRPRPIVGIASALTYCALWLLLHLGERIQQAIDSGITKQLVSFLTRHDASLLQIEAGWALTNITSGSTEQCATVVEEGAVPILCDLLSSPDEGVIDQALWALSNIAGDSREHRDVVLRSGILEPLLRIVDDPKTQKALLKTAVWGVLSNLCREWKHGGPFHLITPALPTLCRLINLHVDAIGEEVLAECCWSVGNLCEMDPVAVLGMLVETGVYDRLVELLAHPSQTIQTPCCKVFWRRASMSATDALALIRQRQVRLLVPYRTEALLKRLKFHPNPLHSVHLMHWLDKSTCSWLVQAAEEFAESHNGWSTARHKANATTDLEVGLIPIVRDWLVERLEDSLLPTLAELFRLDAHRLCVQEVFLVKYTANSSDGTSTERPQSGLQLHRDGYPLSFNVLLRDPLSFTGGGTEFQTLGKVMQPQNVGDVLMHSGKVNELACLGCALTQIRCHAVVYYIVMFLLQMLHGAASVLDGVRYILVGFVAVTKLRNLHRLDGWDDVCADTGGDLDYEVLREHWATMCTEGESEDSDSSDNSDNDNTER